MEKVIRGEITKYLDEKADETVDRNELQGIVQRVILKMWLNIKMQKEDEEEL